MRAWSATAKNVVVEALVGTHFVISRWPDDAHARVPFPAASVIAHPSRPDGPLHTRRLQGPVKTRVESRKALKRGRYLCAELLVNLRRSAHRAGKVEHIQRALCLIVTTHLRCMPSEHPFMLELASRPLMKLPCSPPRTIHALGRLARKGGCTSSVAGDSINSTSARLGPSTSCVL